MRIVILLFIVCALAGFPPSLQAAVIYKGLTASTYDGSQGGSAGMNSKCNGDYAGSHMCTQSEIQRSGATSLPGTGWVSCDSIGNYYDGATAYSACIGVTGINSSATLSMTCNAWTNNANVGAFSWFGPSVSSTGNFGQNVCYNAIKIHCCK